MKQFRVGVYRPDGAAVLLHDIAVDSGPLYYLKLEINGGVLEWSAPPGAEIYGSFEIRANAVETVKDEAGVP